jgi:hypothetical protein
MFRMVPPTHRERIAQLNAQYDLDTHGDLHPFGHPWGSLGICVVITYLLIPHDKYPTVRKARFVVWALNTAFAAYAIAFTRGRGAVAAYAIGFAMAWSILWTTILIIINDGQSDFARIERASGSTGRVRHEGANQKIVESPRNNKDCWTEPKSRAGSSTSTVVKLDGAVHAEMDCSKGSSLIWQHYPYHPFLERLDWVLDLMTNFRGMAWNWRISNLPNPPKEVSKQLLTHIDPIIYHSRSKTIDHVFPSQDVLLRNSLRDFIVGYLVLDVIKTLIAHDAFFFTGDFNLPGPSYLPRMLSSSPSFMKSQRLLLAQLAVYWALETIFKTASLIFVGMLGSQRIGVRGQYWMYPREWGSYSTVFNRGLAGWWGEWWHQTFRYAFASPGKKLVQFLNLHPRSFSAKALQLYIAFSLSGFLHANASHTSIGETRPLCGPFLFFFLQPLGIIAQTASSKVLTRAGITQHMPIAIRQLTNFLFVHVWFYYTAPRFIGDVAAGGQFLYEPIPISILRGMGFGPEGDSWYCWDGPWPKLYRGRYWWESGIVT